MQREYGVQPDPILPRQFFDDGATADMAEPPPPVERRTRNLTVDGQATTRKINPSNTSTADTQTPAPESSN